MLKMLGKWWERAKQPDSWSLLKGVQSDGREAVKTATVALKFVDVKNCQKKC